MTISITINSLSNIIYINCMCVYQYECFVCTQKQTEWIRIERLNKKNNICLCKYETKRNKLEHCMPADLRFFKRDIDGDRDVYSRLTSSQCETYEKTKRERNVWQMQVIRSETFKKKEENNRQRTTTKQGLMDYGATELKEQYDNHGDKESEIWHHLRGDKHLRTNNLENRNGRERGKRRYKYCIVYISNEWYNPRREKRREASLAGSGLYRRISDSMRHDLEPEGNFGCWMRKQTLKFSNPVLARCIYFSFIKTKIEPSRSSNIFKFFSPIKSKSKYMFLFLKVVTDRKFYIMIFFLKFYIRT